MPKPNGGKRPGAGRPKGAVSDATLTKLAAREFLRQRVTAQLGPLIDAQLSNALGIKYLVVRDKKTGKFIRVTGAIAAVTLGKHEEVLEVWEKDPSSHAFSDLMDRALDKPKEQEIDVNVTTHEAEARVARLVAARARVKKQPEK